MQKIINQTHKLSFNFKIFDRFSHSHHSKNKMKLCSLTLNFYVHMLTTKEKKILKNQLRKEKCFFFSYLYVYTFPCTLA